MSPPSGSDTLEVRQTYFRKRRARHVAWRRPALLIIFGVLGCALFVAGVGGLVLGS
jgi:hypothetical protein